MAQSTSGYLLIADISGYTCYLSRSELEHAQGTLSALIELLIEHTKPPLAISRLEGDAVISYALAGVPLHGQTFVEGLEATYVAFRKAIELMVLNNTCQCNACGNVSMLDLKFFVHHGVFGIQQLGGHDELVGTDVNLIHRLLKNRVVETTGIPAYILYTDAALRNLGLEGFREQLIPHAEEYEHIGRVEAWIQDLSPVWQRGRAQNLAMLPPDQVLTTVETEVAAPREVVWDYMVRPGSLMKLLHADRLEVSVLARGRIAEGSQYQCFHGDTVVRFTVLDWQPFERILINTLMPLPFPNIHCLFDYVLKPSGRGTRFLQVVSKARGSLIGRVFCDLAVRRMMAKKGKDDLDQFARYIEEDFAAHGGLASADQTVPKTAVREAVAASLSVQAGA